MNARIKRTLVAAALGFATLGFAPLSAQASPTLPICNASNSDGPIQARNTSTLQEWKIGPGYCANVNDSGGNARVDVDPAGGVDIDSYRKKIYTQAWSECYVSENGSSNPYSSTAAQQYGQVYEVSVNSYCIT